MGGDYLNYFSDRERRSIKRLARVRTVLTRRLLPLLRRLRLTPNRISYIGLSLLVPLVFVFDDYPLLGSALLLAYTLLDAIDGSYARLTGMASQHGALIDIAVDQMGMVVVGLCAVHYDLVHPTLGAFYVAVYLVMISLSVWQNSLRIPMQPILRSKYFLYVLYFIWGISHVNLFNYLIPVFAAAHSISAVHSFARIKHYLQQIDLPKKHPAGPDPGRN